ncbi:tyrosine-type recombinase/integrase [Verrucomicrobiales bacterium]|nr:tyrosine-type recombinase/integrase [Verrucomicrobiales bacterium]
MMKKIETLYSYLYKKTNGIWAVKYKFHKQDGYKYASLGTRNKREAEKKKRAFDLSLEQTVKNIGNNGINDEMLELVGEVLKTITSGKCDEEWVVKVARQAHHIQSGGASATEDYTLAEWIDAYVERISRDVKPQTHEGYVSYSLPLKGLIRYRLGCKLDEPSKEEVASRKVEKISKKPLHLLEAKDIRTIEEHLLKGSRRATTINQSVAILKRALRQASKDELTHKDLSQNIDYAKTIDSYKRGTYTKEEVEVILKESKGCWKGVILTAIETGLRATNCHELKWEDVNLEERKIGLIPVKRRKGTEDEGWLELPILENGRLLPLLESLAITAGEDRSGYIFSTSKLAEESRSRAFKKIREDAGVPYYTTIKKAQYKRDFHSLRHYHNTLMRQTGASAEECMRQLGHANLDTNLKYNHDEAFDKRKDLLEKAFA